MENIESARKWFLHTALAYLGRPYIWGGDDPSGFDCSGLVVECLKTVGLMGEHDDANANRLAERFKSYHVKSPESGCLLLYRKGQQCCHVAICLDPFHQISAGGGDINTIDIETAWKQNAYIRIRPIPELSPGHLIVDPFRSISDQPSLLST